MKRNMELIRKLMLSLEAMPMRYGAILHINPEDFSAEASEYSSDEINYHIHLIVDAGLIDTGNFRPMNGIGFRGFTWSGHDLLDSIRDPEIWGATKGAVDQVGGFSVDLLKALAKGFIKKKIELHTGIDLDL